MNVILRSGSKGTLDFIRNCDSLPKWLYEFEFPPTMNESSYTAFDIVSVSELDFFFFFFGRLMWAGS